MLTIVVLVLLTGLLMFWISRTLAKDFQKTKDAMRGIKNEGNRLEQAYAGLKEANASLQEALDQTVAIYDLTRQICKSLDESKVYASFLEQLDKFIKVEDCRYIKSEAELEKYKHYTVLPLEISHKTIGYLVADGIKERTRDKFLILAHQFMLGIKRVLLYQKVQELAITDGLTSTFTRRYYQERFAEEIERSKKFHYHASFLMADIDTFKDFNDRYGHLVGDAILKEVARTVKENIRQVDAVGRFGGEEFIVILTETDKNGARFAAERIRQAVEDKRIKVYDEDLKVTISIGVSTFPEDAKDLDAVIDKADKALYRAKQGGRNRVTVFGINR